MKLVGSRLCGYLNLGFRIAPSTAEKLFAVMRISSTDSALAVRLVVPLRARPLVLVSSTV